MRQASKLIPFDWILIGLLIHSLGGMFFYTNKPVCYALCGLGLIIILFNVIFRISFKKPFKGLIFILFIFYLVWMAFIVTYPFISDEPFSMDGFSLINQFTILALTPPLIVFLGTKNISLNSIFKFSYIQGIIGIILLILNYRVIFGTPQKLSSEGYLQYLSIISVPLQFLVATSFMVLCYKFIPARYRFVAFSTLILAVYTFLVSARRGNVVMYLLILFFAFYIYVIGSKKGSSKGMKFVLVVAICLVGFGFFSMYANSTFSFFLSRLEEDTRSNVEEAFLNSFDGNTLDWIIGRGLNGSYYSTMDNNPYRREIETGYYHLILKGGIVYLSLFVFFLLHSAYLGFFRTKNTLTKAMSLNLIAHVLFLFPFGLPAFNFEYIILWTCVLYCQSKAFRKLNDNEVKLHLHFN